MDVDFVSRLTPTSALRELPASTLAMELTESGEALSKTFGSDPSLPGVVITENGEIRGAISRGQFLRLIGRNYGPEVYFPRPLLQMLNDLKADEDPLILDGDTPIQQAVRHALLRSPELVYEPVIIRSPGLNGAPPRIGMVHFQDLLMADSRISVLRNRQMAQILSTVQEGLLLVGPDYRIAAEYSTSIEALLGTDDLAGRFFPELIAERLGSEYGELAGDYLDTMFNPNVIEKLIASINPLRKVAAQLPNGDRKHLTFRFKRSVEDETIDRVLVRIEDVSREVALASELEEQEKRGKQRLTLAIEVVQSEPEALLRFLDTFERDLAGASKLQNGPLGDSELAALFRSIHARKGEAGVLHLTTCQSSLHRLEDRIVELRNRPAGDRSADRLADDLELLEALTGEIRGLIKQLATFGRRSGGSSQLPAAKISKPPGLFNGIPGLVGDLAKRLGKQVRFVSRVAQADLPGDTQDLLREILGQLCRNAVIHGIELPEVRLRAGKPAVGTLQLAKRDHTQRGEIELIFQDDGAGLDIKRLRAAAQRLGIAARSEKELKMLVFHSGLSTAHETTIDAGRGIGMDMIKERITARGGRIIPHSKPGTYCAFQILLPNHQTQTQDGQ